MNEPWMSDSATRELVLGGAKRSLSGSGPYPKISDDLGQQAHYVYCRMCSVSHKLAEMFALGQPPMSNTDREFLEGTGEQFADAPHMGNYYRHVAESEGKNVKGHTYISGLARYPGDPEAWITGRGDAKRVVESRGWNCTGSVNVKGREAEPPSGKYRVADDLVEARAAQLVAQGLAKPGEEASEKAREQLSPKPAPKVET